MIPFTLLGRRAVYTHVIHAWEGVAYVEKSRKLYQGTIAGLIAVGNTAYVVFLYDDGALRTHPVDDITVVAESAEPYRG